jgi:hypothetical protein
MYRSGSPRNEVAALLLAHLETHIAIHNFLIWVYRIKGVFRNLILSSHKHAALIRNKIVMESMNTNKIKAWLIIV